MRRLATALILAVGMQISLGIATLLTGVAIPIAASHQGMAVLLLATLLATSHRLGARTGASAGEPSPVRADAV